MAWLAATRAKGVAASVCYYGGSIPDFVGEKPNVPVLLHFGEKDTTPSPETGKETRMGLAKMRHMKLKNEICRCLQSSHGVTMPRKMTISAEVTIAVPRIPYLGRTSTVPATLNANSMTRAIAYPRCAPRPKRTEEEQNCAAWATVYAINIAGSRGALAVAMSWAIPRAIV